MAVHVSPYTQPQCSRTQYTWLVYLLESVSSLKAQDTARTTVEMYNVCRI